MIEESGIFFLVSESFFLIVPALNWYILAASPDWYWVCAIHVGAGRE